MRNAGVNRKRETTRETYISSVLSWKDNIAREIKLTEDFVQYSIVDDIAQVEFLGSW